MRRKQPTCIRGEIIHLHPVPTEHPTENLPSTSTSPIWTFPKISYPQIIHFDRVFHYKHIINHPFWGTPIFGNTEKNGYFGLIPKPANNIPPNGSLENHWKNQGTYPSSGECLYPKLERLVPGKWDPDAIQVCWKSTQKTQGKVMNKYQPTNKP